jgi:hypothetical protein
MIFPQTRMIVIVIKLKDIKMEKLKLIHRDCPLIFGLKKMDSRNFAIY